MTFPRSFRRFFCWLVFAAGWLLAARGASAQQQERKLVDRIMRPDMELHAEGFGKAFAPATGSSEKKSFVTRLFGGSHAAIPRGGDGSFHTSGFVSRREGYAAADFPTRKLPQAGQTASLSDHTFGTKPLAVREDAAAGKTATIRGYETADKPFLGRGTHQDDIDDLRRQKALTIDQVREILNKKG